MSTSQQPSHMDLYPDHAPAAAGSSLPPDFPRASFSDDQLDELEHYYHRRLLTLAQHLLHHLIRSPSPTPTLAQIGANVHLLTHALGLSPCCPHQHLALALGTRKTNITHQLQHLLRHMMQHPQALSPEALSQALHTTADSICNTSATNKSSSAN